ncbi:MAG: hypothetical protein RLZZ345_961, partial [Actinomycetota bacterium]
RTLSSAADPKLFTFDIQPSIDSALAPIKIPSTRSLDDPSEHEPGDP